jgi:hypothetical protein
MKTSFCLDPLWALEIGMTAGCQMAWVTGVGRGAAAMRVVRATTTTRRRKVRVRASRRVERRVLVTGMFVLACAI